ncbi:MAG: hypothetical protein JRG96_05875 [Deltaproteobacteria bacterium]|nr:hypothetical protein [Deltaproteobacteria bacterium]MBW2420671.1 hypothetical protein [Deltaproteobacteria bacterium]
MIERSGSARLARGLALGVVLAVLGLGSSAAAGDSDAAAEDEEREVIDMQPEGKKSFGKRNLAAPIGSLFRGTDYWYKERRVDVDTTPSGGFVDLFYVRSNFQKRFEQGQAPLTVILPPRIDTKERDSLRIRAFREGYRQKSVSLPVSSKATEVVIDLDPLPNMLEALSHRYFAGRSALTFLTKESLTFRVQEAAAGITVILTETAISAEAGAALDGVASPLIAEASAVQVGEDQVVNIDFSDGAADGHSQIRSREGFDAARDLHAFTLDIVPAAGSGEAVAQAKAAIARLERSDVTGCALVFDSSLRKQLDRGALSRALTPGGSFTDPYLRAAMRRLGELVPGDGAVELDGGERFRPAVPIELELLLSRAGEARGYLVLLWQLVVQLESEAYRQETFRSLVAPELDPKSFGVIFGKAEAGEKSCQAPT